MDLALREPSLDDVFLALTGLRGKVEPGEESQDSLNRDDRPQGRKRGRG